ncbi:hypothetical protein OG689_10500 [Kitasatospora sp. NBC_00240]|uniref:hypothetical protein n=1 Tax=Kitasatospora sp. NBC_00240 TaxID=2903567 RepID=UPI00224FD0A5|nr:hypothetical protein [Kitasatospora sp. NBC_00240]MCX5209712.1 hypothetical protein [Kitasatospora sp. NBC_00240]
MFGNAKLRKQIDALTATVNEQRRHLQAARADYAIATQGRAEWAQRAERIGDDRVADNRELTRAKLANASLVLQLSVQAPRIARAVRACARYRQEIGSLQRQVAAQDRLITNAERLGDRALQPALPSPELERLRRENRELRELTYRQQDQLSAHQAASMLADRGAQRPPVDLEPAAA